MRTTSTSTWIQIRMDTDSTDGDESCNRTAAASGKATLGKVPSDVVASIEALVASPSRHDDDGLLVLSHSCNRVDHQHDEHVRVVADFLASRISTKQAEKGALDETVLVCVQVLLSQDPCPEAELRKACRFLVDPAYEHETISPCSWEPPLARMVLWWELRAQIKSRRLKQQNRSEWLLKASDAVANGLATSAHCMERGLHASVPYVHTGLDRAGIAAKHVLTPNPEATVFLSPKDEIVTLTYADMATRATSGIHTGAKTLVNTIRDASADSIGWTTEKFQQNRLGERLLPDTNKRNAVQAAGKVGLATVGAVAIVVEAVWDVTRQVAHKTSYVTADVIRHKYGKAAGTLAEHASDTTGNVVRTVAHVTMLETSVLAKVVAKNSGKEEIRRRSDEGQKASEDQIIDTDERILDEEDDDDRKFPPIHDPSN